MGIYEDQKAKREHLELKTRREKVSRESGGTKHIKRETIANNPKRKQKEES